MNLDKHFNESNKIDDLFEELEMKLTHLNQQREALLREKQQAFDRIQDSINKIKEETITDSLNQARDQLISILKIYYDTLVLNTNFQIAAFRRMSGRSGKRLFAIFTRNIDHIYLSYVYRI